MKFIVDANVVFSAILNTNGKIGDLLLHSEKYFQFIAPDFLRSEIKNHYSKLMKVSGLSFEEIVESEFQLYKRIHFISPEQIRVAHWQAADALVSDVDPNDTHYIAYSKHFNCSIWSGDKKLMKGLALKGFRAFVTTEDIMKLREKLAN